MFSQKIVKYFFVALSVAVLISHSLDADLIKNNPYLMIVLIFGLTGVFFLFKLPYFIYRDFIDLPDSALERYLILEGDLLKKISRHLENTKNNLRPEQAAFIESISKLNSYLPMEVTDNFNEYCDKCINMLDYSEGKIYTVQTPHEVSGDIDASFKKYINRTVDKLLERRNGNPLIYEYKRLVVIDSTSLNEEIHKLKIFLEFLFEKGNKILALGETPTYDNIKLCIVTRDIAAQFFYSNLDVHIPSQYNYSLAFQKAKDDSNKYEWSSSLHVKAHDKITTSLNTSSLISSFGKLWDKGKSLGGEIDFKYAYRQHEKNFFVEQEKVVNDIFGVARKLVTISPSGETF